jgi:hypothetical protein
MERMSEKLVNVASILKEFETPIKAMQDQFDQAMKDLELAQQHRAWIIAHNCQLRAETICSCLSIVMTAITRIENPNSCT